MSESVLENTIYISDPADENVKFEFRVPTIKDQMALGMRARAIRRENDPTGAGDLTGLDSDTAMLSWSLGAFEILLTAAGAKWPYTADKDGKPVVNYRNFPADKFDTVLLIGYKLDAEIGRFRQKWSADWKPAGEKTVDSVSNTGA